MLLLYHKRRNEHKLVQSSASTHGGEMMFTDRNRCSYSTSVHCFLHRVGVEGESGSEGRSNKDDLGKVSREIFFFSYVVLASRVKVGPRAAVVAKND